MIHDSRAQEGQAIVTTTKENEKEASDDARTKDSGGWSAKATWEHGCPPSGWRSQWVLHSVGEILPSLIRLGSIFLLLFEALAVDMGVAFDDSELPDEFR